LSFVVIIFIDYGNGIIVVGVVTVVINFLSFFLIYLTVKNNGLKLKNEISHIISNHIGRGIMIEYVKYGNKTYIFHVSSNMSKLREKEDRKKEEEDQQLN